MEPKIIGPELTGEALIQRNLVKYLEIRDWFVMTTHGSTFQSGFPDLYIAHYKYGTRWVEVKQPKYYRFTRAQMHVFPKLSHNRVGIWILTAATEEEYLKLFKAANWHMYLKKGKY